MTWQPDDAREEDLDELMRALALGELMFGRDAVLEVLTGALMKRRDEILAEHPESVAAELIREREAAG